MHLPGQTWRGSGHFRSRTTRRPCHQRATPVLDLGAGASFWADFAAARVTCGTQLLHLGPILLPPSTLRYPTAAFRPFFAAAAVRAFRTAGALTVFQGVKKRNRDLRGLIRFSISAPKFQCKGNDCFGICKKVQKKRRPEGRR